MKAIVRIVVIGILAAKLDCLTAQVPDTNQSASVQRVMIEGSERYTLDATQSKHSYLIDVARVDSTIVPVPPGYQLPVVYVLDGNSQFPLVSQMASSIVTFSRQIPAMLVVSIGYPADPQLSRQKNIENRLAWRSRDFMPKIGPGGKAPVNMGEIGGADDFLAFINDDLKPFIAARYAVNQKDQTLAGHSSGGLFTMYALLHSPTSFQRYVAASPSLFWDDHSPAKLAAALSTDHVRSVPTRVFISVGGLETKERMGEDMIGDAKDFASELEKRKIAGLETKFQLFPDENHISVIPSAFMRGLLEVGALR
jgi:predicted alpha/beta superfamily hydrolase